MVDRTFLEFFAISRASSVVLSQRWSAYSLTACLVSSERQAPSQAHSMNQRRRPCDYTIVLPHPAQLQTAHRAGYDATFRPPLLHVVGCHADHKGSRLPLPPRWLSGFRASGALITNACEGVAWPGHPPTDYHPHPTLAKPRAMLQLLRRLVAEGDGASVVLFAEDDVIINFADMAHRHPDETIAHGNALASAVLERFEEVRGKRSVVFGVEPFCWLSRACTGEEIQELYPRAAAAYSRCPAFVNVGLYIGHALPLLELLAAWVERTEPGDQERLVKAWRAGSYAVQLDWSEGLFATAMSATRLAKGASKQLHECSPCAGNTSCRCDTTIQHAWERSGDEAEGSSFRRPADYRAECGIGRRSGPLFIHGNGPSEGMLSELERWRRSSRQEPAHTIINGEEPARHHKITPSEPSPSRTPLALVPPHTASLTTRVRVIVRSCLAHAPSWASVKQTWGALLSFVYAGDPNQDERWRLRERELIIQTGDGYDNLPAKLVLALVYFADQVGGAVLHVDDDARLVGPFTPQLEGIDYGGPRLQGAHRRGANRTGHWEKVPPDSYWYQRLAPPHNAVGHTFAHGTHALAL